MICPKCKKDLPDEIAFCPYCMTKFSIGENYNEVKKEKKSKIPFIVIGILSVIILAGIIYFVCFFNNEKGENSVTTAEPTTKKVEEANTTDKSKEVEPTTTEKVEETKPKVDMLSYCGTWYNKDFEGEDPMLEGGNILKIISINEDTVIFDLCSYQSPPSSRIAELNGITAKIIDGKSEFIFGDDGWGNGGIGTLTFMENEIYVNIKLTSVSSDSLWSIGSDVIFKKVEDGYENDTVDFLGLLGEDIQVALSLLGNPEYTIEQHDEGITYNFEGMFIDLYIDRISCVYVKYPELPEGYRDKYKFSYGIDGNTSFDSLESRLGEPISTGEEEEGVYVSCFNVPDRPGEYFKIAYSEGEVVYIMYFYVTN